MHVGEEVRIRQDFIALRKERDDEPESHEDEQHAHDGVEAADDTVERNDGGYEVIGENEHAPGQRGRGGEQIRKEMGEEAGKQRGRSQHEGGPHHDHEENGEAFHEHTHAPAEVAAYDLGVAYAVFTDGNHTGDVVVHRTGKNGAEHHPQQGHGAVESTENGAQHGAEPGDVDHLAHIELPEGHGLEVHAVPSGHDGSFAGAVSSENTFNKSAVQRIAGYEQRAAAEEIKGAKHNRSGLSRPSMPSP